MNPEYLGLPHRKFRVKNGEKLVRDGVFKIMETEGDQPVLSQGAGSRRSVIIRNKVKEELSEFEMAGTRDDQVAEAGDFLAISELMIRTLDVTQDDSKLLGTFQALMEQRKISINEAEIARVNKAEKEGEFSRFIVVSAVHPQNNQRAEAIYSASAQWEEVPAES